jgi:hypothetical protein
LHDPLVEVGRRVDEDQRLVEVFVDVLVGEDVAVLARELVDDAAVVDSEDDEVGVEVEEEAVWLKARYPPAAAMIIMTTNTAATVDLPIARLNFN